MSELGHPPEFGSSGQAPAIESSAVLVAEDFYFDYASTTQRGSIAPVELLLQRRQDELSSDMVTVKRWLDQRTIPERPQGRLTIGGAVGGLRGVHGAAALGAAAAAALAPIAGVVIGAGAAGYLFHRRRKQQGGHGSTSRVPEVRRLQLYRRWVRDDPISQLAPGSNSSKTVEVTVGLSQQTTRELAAYLGVGALTAAALSGQISAKVVSALTLTSEEKRSHTVTLDNRGNENRYRRFAIWHIEDQLQIDVLQSTAGNLCWQPLKVVSYIPSANAAILTSTDIAVRP